MQDNFGTVDYIFIVHGILDIVDYRHVKEIEDSKVGDPQMQLYALDTDQNSMLTGPEVYSGVYGHASIYAFNRNCSKGISCGLNNRQLIHTSEPLGGKVSAESDFAANANDDFLN